MPFAALLLDVTLGDVGGSWLNLLERPCACETIKHAGASRPLRGGLIGASYWNGHQRINPI